MYLIYLYVIYMCVSACLVPLEAMSILDPLELELQMGVGCNVGGRNCT